MPLSEIFIALTQSVLLTRMIGLSDAVCFMRRGKGIALTACLTALFSLADILLFAGFGGFLPEGARRVFLPLFCAVVNALLDLLLAFALRRLFQGRAWQVCLHSAAFSGVALGMTLGAENLAGNLKGAFVYALRADAGYLLALILLWAALPALSGEKTPRLTRGWLAGLFFAGLLAMACACIAQTQTV